jgi:undecaprenyl-phosphate 4-deoxy-4-formamido-L-arabinose transferase
LVNDGSPDPVAGVITSLCKTQPEIVFVNLSRNFGQHSALMAGFAQVRGDIVICLDDDGQTPADECFKLIDKIREGYDLVFAEYPMRKQNAFRNLGSRFNAACNHFFFGQPKGLKANSYYACQRFVVDSALTYPNPFPYVTGLLFQSVARYANVAVSHRPREQGESGYNLKKLIALWANGVTAFSIKPLRMASYLGWATAICGFLFALITVIRKLVNPAMQAGWASTIALLMALGGVIIALIGIVGEYIGRIYLSINRCPQYVVRNVIDSRANADKEGATSEREPCPGGPAR